MVVRDIPRNSVLFHPLLIRCLAETYEVSPAMGSEFLKFMSKSLAIYCISNFSLSRILILRSPEDLVFFNSPLSPSISCMTRAHSVSHIVNTVILSRKPANALTKLLLFMTRCGLLFFVDSLFLRLQISIVICA